MTQTDTQADSNETQEQSRRDGMVMSVAGLLVLGLGLFGFGAWFQAFAAHVPLPWMAGVEALFRMLFAKVVPAACLVLGTVMMLVGLRQYWTGRRSSNERNQVNEQ